MKKRCCWISVVVTVTWIAALSCTHQPVHPTKSEREWAADHQACQVWAREVVRSEPDTHDQYDEMKMIRACMKEKGWRWEQTGLLRFFKPAAE